MNPRQRALLVAIASFWQDWGTAPSTSQLAEITELCMEDVWTELYALERVGWIQFRRETGKGLRRPLNAELTGKAEEILPRLRQLQ